MPKTETRVLLVDDEAHYLEVLKKSAWSKRASAVTTAGQQAARPSAFCGATTLTWP